MFTISNMWKQSLESAMKLLCKWINNDRIGKESHKNYVNLQEIDTKQCWVEAALDRESMSSMLLVHSNAENKCVD
jgi:hypothetical protein